jgi:hypothetical protein
MIAGKQAFDRAFYSFAAGGTARSFATARRLQIIEKTPRLACEIYAQIWNIPFERTGTGQRANFEA